MPFIQHLCRVRPFLEIGIVGDLRSTVIASYLVRPNPLRISALPPSLYSMTSEERFKPPTLLTAAAGCVLFPNRFQKSEGFVRIETVRIHREWFAHV